MALDTLAAVATAPAAQGKTSSAVTPTALAPGFRFHPTDEELVSYYLKRKVLNKPVRFNAIAEVDIYKKEPWELSESSRLKTRDQEWYFFSALDKKYGNGARMNRATGQGYWKATGKDREIRREVQLIGMKKTLVFHSGRAPDGIRTNWVMHEYRLIDDELEKGVAIKNAYVLCRVFHKNNIGPPSGNRYAPFVEEEWDDGKAALVPREDAKDDQVFAEIQSANKDININELPTEAQIGGDEIVYTPFDYELPRSSKHVFPVCKREKMDDCPPVCMLNKQASSIPLLYYKRRRQVDLGINLSSGSDDSPKTPQEHCSSTTTTAATPASSSATTTAISALLEFCLMESVETKEKEKKEKEKFPVGPATYGAALVDPTIPRSCVKLLSDMQSEIDQTTAERDNLKLEILKSQAMISILHSRIDYLMKENEDMKKIMSNAK